jgi:hypothetical protein
MASAPQREWTRLVERIGNKGAEDKIAEELNRRWPASKFSVDINVICDHVQIFNFSKGIEVAEQFDSTKYLDGCSEYPAFPSVCAALDKVAEIIDRLQSEQKL